MTVVLNDPLENLTNWSTVSGSPSIVTGRTGNGVALTGSSAAIQYTIPAVNEGATLTMSFDWKTTNAGVNAFIAAFHSDAGATIHNQLSPRSTGAIQVTRGGTGIATSAATGLFVAGTWYRIEWKVLLADSGGTVSVKVDGVERINTAALDTRNAGTKTVYDRIRLVAPGVGVTSTFDNVLLEVPSPAGAKAWNGAAFVDAPVKAWNGSAFVDAAAVKTWNGSAFV